MTQHIKPLKEDAGREMIDRIVITVGKVNSTSHYMTGSHIRPLCGKKVIRVLLQPPKWMGNMCNVHKLLERFATSEEISVRKGD